MSRVARVALAPLAAEGALVTRAQARALLAGYERAIALELDFAGVEAIGQGFADELFRVWPLQHPSTRVSAVHATGAVLSMIRHVRARGDLPQPREADP